MYPTALNSMSESSPLIYLIRHGETEWALDGRHTGNTNIPLTARGREQAVYLEPIFHEVEFERIMSSPLDRALETARIAGLGDRVLTSDNLREWDYGKYEGITTKEIRQTVPGWTVWTHSCPDGESPEDVGRRADRIIDEVKPIKGNVALFSHGHFLRVLAARWVGFPPQAGKHFLLGTSTLSILGYEHEYPAIKTWNGPLLTAACAVPWRHPHGP